MNKELKRAIYTKSWLKDDCCKNPTKKNLTGYKKQQRNEMPLEKFFMFSEYSER